MRLRLCSGGRAALLSVVLQSCSPAVLLLEPAAAEPQKNGLFFKKKMAKFGQELRPNGLCHVCLCAQAAKKIIAKKVFPRFKPDMAFHEAEQQQRKEVRAQAFPLFLSCCVCVCVCVCVLCDFDSLKAFVLGPVWHSGPSMVVLCRCGK